MPSRCSRITEPQEIVIEFFHNGKIGITADKNAVAILRDNAKIREGK